MSRRAAPTSETISVEDYAVAVDPHGGRTSSGHTDSWWIAIVFIAAAVGTLALIGHEAHAKEP